MAVAEAETTEINYPEWTEYRKKNGLDPEPVNDFETPTVSIY